MNNTIYITGHKNPDTDSICSALCYEDLKKKLGFKNVKASRLGNVNNETKFALDYFGVDAPALIDTVKTQISDLDIDKISAISQNLSLKKAWSIMEEKNVKTLPVADENGKLVGLASLSNITSTYMGIWHNDVLTKCGALLSDIRDTLSAEIVYEANNNSKFQGKIIVASMQPENMKNHIKKGDIVICGNRFDTQEAILNCSASLMVITGNHSIDDSIIKKAKEANCSLIVTPYDSFTTSLLITQSLPVSYIMTKENISSFKLTDFVEDVKEAMLKTRFRNYPVVDENNCIVGTISRYHLMSAKKKQVILVDHNESEQSVDGLNESEILEVIDHHKIGNIETDAPIYFRNQPVGCTATIITNMFFENGLTPSKKIAGLLSSAIISDTLLFKSPTSTELDKVTLKKLAEIAEIDPEKYSVEMFKAGTSLKGKTVKQLLHEDFKNFSLEGHKIGVGQVSTMDAESFNPLKEDMIKLMEKEAEEDSYDGLVLILTDLLKEGSYVYAIGKDSEVIASAFGKELEDGYSLYAPGVLSRKKQVVPPITKAIKDNN